MSQEAIKVLTHLVQVDIDAVRAYGQAIERCDDPQIARRLDGFRSDHERHVRDLSEQIRSLGGTPPEMPDATGFFIEGFTGLTSATGAASALAAMKSNEIVANDAYEQALAADLPDHIRSIVVRNADDERRHLRAVEEMLGRVSGSSLLSQGASMHGRISSAWVNSFLASPLALFAAGLGLGVLAGAMQRRRAEAASFHPEAYRRDYRDEGAWSETRSRGVASASLEVEDESGLHRWHGTPSQGTGAVPDRGLH